jgi:hypothetical protein
VRSRSERHAPRYVPKNRSLASHRTESSDRAERAPPEPTLGRARYGALTAPTVFILRTGATSLVQIDFLSERPEPRQGWGRRAAPAMLAGPLGRLVGGQCLGRLPDRLAQVTFAQFSCCSTWSAAHPGTRPCVPSCSRWIRARSTGPPPTDTKGGSPPTVLTRACGHLIFARECQRKRSGEARLVGLPASRGSSSRSWRQRHLCASTNMSPKAACAPPAGHTPLLSR